MTETIGLQAVFDTSQFTNGLRVYVQGVDQATGKTKQAEQGAAAAGSVLQTALGTAFGALAARFIPAAIGALSNFVTSGISAVSQLQQLDIMLESLTAKQLVQSGAAANLNEAMSQTGPIADALLSKLRDLSLVSPFEYTDVVNTFRLNMAFGQSADTSLGLTKAITDMAAAMGLSGPYLERIAYNFSQMSLVGKVSARDIRDLAMAGVDLTDVLRSQLGMSVEEVNAALESGKLTMQDVSQAFIGYAETNFAGAAERMSRSLSGLKSSFKDLGFFASQDILGPVLAQITDDLGGLYDRVKEFIDSGGLKLVGQGLLDLYNIISGLPGIAAQAGQNLVEMLFGPIQGAAENAYTWGVSLINNYAQGIIEGAVSALIAAMNYISDLLAYWLAPGSPPLVAPELDQWGAGAMDSYLEGFSDADFSSLKSLQGPMQDVFGLFEKSGALGEGGADALFAQFSQGFSAMIASGKKDQSFFDQLTASAGSFGDELAALASANFDLAMATDAVAQAEKAQQDAINKSADLTREYNDLLLQGASQDVLDAKLAEINAQEAIAQAAGKNLSANKDQITALQDEIDLREQALDQLTTLADKSIPDAAKAASELGGGLDTGGAAGGIKKPSSAGGAGGGGAGGIESLGSKLAGGFDKILEEAKAKAGKSADEIKAELVGKLSGIFGPIREKWNRDFAPVFTKLISRFQEFVAQLRDAWSTFSDRFTQAMKPATDWWYANWPKIQQFAVTAIDAIKQAWNAMVQAIQPAIESLTQTLKEMGIDWETVAKAAEFLAKVIGVTLASAIVVVTGLIISFLGFISGLAQGFADFAKEVQSGLQQITQGFKGLSSGDIVKTIKGLGDIIMGTVKIIFGAPLKFAGGFLKGMTRYYEKLIDGFGDWSKSMQRKVDTWKKDFSKSFEKAMDAVIDVFKNGFPKVAKAVTDGISKAIDSVKSKLGQWVDLGKQMIENLVNGIKSFASKVSAEVTGAIDGAIDAVRNKVKEFIQQGKDIINNLVNGIKAFATKVATEVTSAITSAVNAVKTKVIEFIAQGQAIINNIISGISQRVSALVSQISTAMSNAISTAKQRLSEFLSVGVSIMQNIIDGIGQRISGIVAQINNAMSSGISAVQMTVSQWVNAGRDIIQGMIDGMVQKAVALQNYIATLAQQIIDYISNILQSASPSKVMIRLGRTVPQGLEQGIREQAWRPITAAQRLASSTVAAATMTSNYSTYNNMANNVYMGGVTINNGMDMSTLDARIRTVMRSEYSR